MDQFVGGKSSLSLVLYHPSHRILASLVLRKNHSKEILSHFVPSFFLVVESSLRSFFERYLEKSSVTPFLRSFSLSNPRFARSSKGTYQRNPQSLRSFVLSRCRILTSFVLRKVLTRINPQSLRSFVLYPPQLLTSFVAIYTTPVGDRNRVGGFRCG
jgi:hypothetical protein